MALRPQSQAVRGAALGLKSLGEVQELRQQPFHTAWIYRIPLLSLQLGASSAIDNVTGRLVIWRALH